MYFKHNVSAQIHRDILVAKMKSVVTGQRKLQKKKNLTFIFLDNLLLDSSDGVQDLDPVLHFHSMKPVWMCV